MTINPPLIQLQNVYKRYGAGEAAFNALQGINLSIDQGRVRCCNGAIGIR